ncbi:hypothetical protein C7455_101304 [Roseicyclus mahoneyensis]|uniref:Uncharacterized protein n=1 Tax=Roseicyclus mahoneyensis TaxID=164332 RepID=A0A316GNP6_9RHOB|nr:hypothetical protein C7455_101304 [Roseicyclus mahoneyensis]
MVDCAKGPTGVKRALVLGCVCVALNGCGSLVAADDPCATANRDVSFSVLMQNSISNVYNMCLENMRQEIVAEWGEQ